VGQGNKTGVAEFVCVLCIVYCLLCAVHVKERCICVSVYVYMIVFSRYLFATVSVIVTMYMDAPQFQFQVPMSCDEIVSNWRLVFGV